LLRIPAFLLFLLLPKFLYFFYREVWLWGASGLWGTLCSLLNIGLSAIAFWGIKNGIMNATDPE
jgi:hypothetical protein